MQEINSQIVPLCLGCGPSKELLESTTLSTQPVAVALAFFSSSPKGGCLRTVCSAEQQQILDHEHVDSNLKYTFRRFDPASLVPRSYCEEMTCLAGWAFMYPQCLNFLWEQCL